MDKNEKASRRAKNAIVQWLVSSEMFDSDKEATKAIEEYEQAPYDKILVTMKYNLERRPVSNANARQKWYMLLCVQMVEQGKAEKTKQLVGV